MSNSLLDAMRTIAAMKTWKECMQATPQIRHTKADISNLLDLAIEIARAEVARAEATK